MPSDASSSPLTDASQRDRETIRARMLAHLPQQHSQPDIAAFYRHLADYPQRQGKMLRGLLLLLSYDAHGGTAAGRAQAVTLAAGLELFQNWVLIHDDIEDDSDQRRGIPTLHRNIGMPLALNVGDALHVYMWTLLHEITHPHKDAMLDEFANMIHRTAEGQHLDLAWVAQGRFDISPQDYIEMVTHKTAYYTVVYPLRLGAWCAGQVLDVSRYVDAGIALGQAFQIRDDVLNLDASVNYGKEFAGDLYEAKRTLIISHTFAKAKEAEAAQLRRLLSKARGEKTPQDITQILAIIQRYEGLTYAQTYAEHAAARGLAQLRAALPANDTSESGTHASAKSELLRLLDTLAHRRL